MGYLDVFANSTVGASVTAISVGVTLHIPNRIVALNRWVGPTGEATRLAGVASRTVT